MEGNTIRKRWPDLGCERLMTDAEIVEQGHRIELRKALLWNEDKLCEMCEKKGTIHTERYCVFCRRIVIEELKACNYLQMLGEPHCGMRRTKEMKEDVFQTKYGADAGTGAYTGMYNAKH